VINTLLKYGREKMGDLFLQFFCSGHVSLVEGGHQILEELWSEVVGRTDRGIHSHPVVTQERLNGQLKIILNTIVNENYK